MKGRERERERERVKEGERMGEEEQEIDGRNSDTQLKRKSD